MAKILLAGGIIKHRPLYFRLQKKGKYYAENKWRRL